MLVLCCVGVPWPGWWHYVVVCCVGHVGAEVLPGAGGRGSCVVFTPVPTAHYITRSLVNCGASAILYFVFVLCMSSPPTRQAWRGMSIRCEW